MVVPDIGNLVLGAGALGTAAFGIVEASKWIRFVGEAGFGRITAMLGAPLLGALEVAYGPGYEKLLRAQYRKDRQTQAELSRTLRQGIRVGLVPDNAEALARHVATTDPELLKRAAAAMHRGADLLDEERNALGKFELAVDTRIDAALTLAQDVYLGTVRMLASAVALGLSFAAAAMLDADWTWALVVGIAAVPLAPIANDVVGALRAAATALGRGRA